MDSATSALHSVTGLIAEEEGDSVSLMEGNQDDAGGGGSQDSFEA